MNKGILKSETLISSFEPGVGEHASRDNTSGTVLSELSKAMASLAMAHHLKEPEYITDDTMTAVCAAIEWFENVFREIES